MAHDDDDWNSDSAHEHKSLTKKVIFIKTHTENYLQAWDESLPGKWFLSSFSCDTKQKISFPSVNWKTFERRLFLFFSVAKIIDFHCIFTRRKMSDLIRRNLAFLSYPTGKYKRKQNNTFYLHNWALEAQLNSPAFSLVVLRTFKLELKSFVEKFSAPMSVFHEVGACAKLMLSVL